VIVPSQQRSLHAIIAQNLKDTEALIGRLGLGRAFIREFYVQARKQREMLSAVLRLELE